MTNPYRSKTLKIDPSAKTMDPNLPAFLSKPLGAQCYYGFPLVPETETDGFVFGAISDFLEPDAEEGCTYGDGFIQAPDGSRAGLIWVVAEEVYLSECMAPEEGRWGVYNVGFVKPIQNLDDLVFNFRKVLPLIKKKYEQVREIRP